MFPANSRSRIRAGLSRPRAPPNRHFTPLHNTRQPITLQRVTTSRPTQQTSSNLSNSLKKVTSSAVDTAYFAVLYTKRSKKKHKSWLDGYIIITNDRLVELLNEDGKKIASERYKPLGGMREGNTLEIASWELEVQKEVDGDDYISGRLFVKPSTQDVISSVKQRAMLPTKRAAFKPLRPKNDFSKATSTVNGPLHDPTAPNAYVLMEAAGDESRGEATVSVVLDPFLAKRMRPHQREGVKFLYNCVQGRFFRTGEGGQGAILADEMGLGKSLQALALIWTLLKQSPRGPPMISKAVIVCPASLVQNWVNEVKKWLGFDRLHPAAVTSGSSTFESKEALASFISGSVRRLLIVSYEMFRSYSEQLNKSSIGLLVCDEGHRLKSSQGNKTIEALKSLPCRARVILTGTPVQNDLEEFFAVCDFVNPGCLRSLTSFRQIFANPIISSRDSSASPESIRMGEARAKELWRITSAFVLRRTSQILAKYLPPKQEIAVFCRLPGKQETLYRREARGYYNDIANCSRFSAALSAITVLRKICCHPLFVENNVAEEFQAEDASENCQQRRGEPLQSKAWSDDFKISDSTKIQVALSICQSSLTIKDKLILVSNYTSALDLLQNALLRSNISFCRLDGSTPVNRRGDIVRRFNNGSMGDVFLLSAKAGGVGLNLIGANRLILFDPDWNPATDLQAMARVWRDGQKKAVFVYRLLCTGTIEEKIFQRQLFKGELRNAVDGEGKISKDPKRQGTDKGEQTNLKEGNFSAEELRDLFQYTGNLEFCDTLEVLERSQEDSTLTNGKGFTRPSVLLERFSNYKKRVQKEYVESNVLCPEDPVLERALNGDVHTFGLVSYLYSSRTDGALLSECDRKQAKTKSVDCEEVEKVERAELLRERNLESMFASDSDENINSDTDEEVKVNLSMRSSGKKRRVLEELSDCVESLDGGQSVCNTTPSIKRSRGCKDVVVVGLSDGITEKMTTEVQDSQRLDEALNDLDDTLEDF